VSDRVNKLRAQRAVQHGLKTRTCGTCNACCIVLGVEEIKKAPGELCKHLAAKGCAIYAHRPTSCREYHCLWRAGQLDGDARPDRLGFVIDIATDKPDLIFAREVRPGALEEKRSMLENLWRKSNAVIVLIRQDSEMRSAIGPSDKVHRYLEEARRKLRVVED